MIESLTDPFTQKYCEYAFSFNWTLKAYFDIRLLSLNFLIIKIFILTYVVLMYYEWIIYTNIFPCLYKQIYYLCLCGNTQTYFPFPCIYKQIYFPVYYKQIYFSISLYILTNIFLYFPVYINKYISLFPCVY